MTEATPPPTDTETTQKEGNSTVSSSVGWRPLVDALALGTSLGIPTAVLVSFGALAGNHLDKKLDDGPLWTLIGVLVGVLAAAHNGWRVLTSKRFSKPTKDSPP
ncbi:MAG: AtpZ/AtpI family protein [Acidobacteriota bacterium]